MIINANTLKNWPIASETIQAVITSPPYFGLRDYGHPDQFGLERLHDCLGWARGENCGKCYVCKSIIWAREAWRVLRDDGIMWLNLGDSYARTDIGALKQKDLIGIPWRIALALQSDCWYLRQDIIWHKPNPMPESVTDRCTKSHEYIFLLCKSARYYWNNKAIAEKSSGVSGGNFSSATANAQIGHGAMKLSRPEDNGTRNARTVWTIATKSYSGAHFATWPNSLVERMVLASTNAGDIVLDPFCGSGTTGAVCSEHRRRFVGMELNEKYIDLAKDRIGCAGVRLW
jgi:site-specific DNA-methyltransferase (adenine-specific)